MKRVTKKTLYRNLLNRTNDQGLVLGFTYKEFKKALKAVHNTHIDSWDDDIYYASEHTNGIVRIEQIVGTWKREYVHKNIVTTNDIEFDGILWKLWRNMARRTMEQKVFMPVPYTTFYKAVNREPGLLEWLGDINKDDHNLRPIAWYYKTDSDDNDKLGIYIATFKKYKAWKNR